MYVVKIYFSLDELNARIKKKLSDDDQEKFKDSCFLPIKVGIRDDDLTLEATFATTR